MCREEPTPRLSYHHGRRKTSRENEFCTQLPPHHAAAEAIHRSLRPGAGFQGALWAYGSGGEVVSHLSVCRSGANEEGNDGKNKGDEVTDV